MRGQVAMEFVLYIMIALFLLILFSALALNLSNNALQKQQREELGDLGASLQEEFITASQITSGYHRRINIPRALNRGSYAINNTATLLTLNSGSDYYTYPIPTTQGYLDYGENTLINKNGTIIID